MDGVTIGHPCCSVFNCELPLRSNRDRFCRVHKDNAKLCRISDCAEPAEPGHRSCSDPAHRALDLANKERGQSFFQLKGRLENARVGHISNSMSLEAEQEEELSDSEEIEVCDAKSPTGNRRLKAKWARSQTHNEQLIVRPCGVILARQTFYASEGVIQAKVIYVSVVPLFRIHD